MTTTRPRTVTVAYWIWLLCAAVLVFFGLLSLTASGDSIRETLTDRGVAADKIDGLLLMLRGSGIISIVVAVGIGLLSGPVAKGDDRFRRTLVALSAAFALLQIFAVIVGISPGILLLVPILLMIAGMLAYRDASNKWFARD